jgi:hypothetical protein
MKYHVITAVLLLVATGLYIAGLSGAGAVAFLAGVAFETWFWARIVIKRSSARTNSSSTTR